MIYRTPPLHSALFAFKRFVLPLLRKYADHLRILASASLFMVPSIWSNAVFLGQFVPSSLATSAGIGLQIAITNLELQLIRSLGGHRDKIRRWLMLMLVGSVLASTLGFIVIQAHRQAAVNAPAQISDDIKHQAKNLAEVFGKGKRLALAHWQNEVQFNQATLDKIRRRMQNGTPTDSDLAAIPMFQDQIQRATQEESRWEHFDFKPSQVTSDPDPTHAFAQLQTAYDEFSTFFGRLPRSTQDGFRVPDAPVQTANARDAIEYKTPIQLLREHLFTFEGMFSLALALFFEAVPFGLAIASSRHKVCDPDAGAEDLETGDEADSDSLTKVLSPMEVQSKMPEPEASNIDGFSKRYRVLSLALANNMGEVIENERSLEPSRLLFKDLSRLPLKTDLRDKIVMSIEASIRKRMDEARRFGRSEQDLEQITADGFKVLSKLYEFEDSHLESLAAAWNHANASAPQGSG